MSAVEKALLAVMAAHEGDSVNAERYISRAQQQARATARRDRQVIEIAALVVAGHHERAAGLAVEHKTEFPGDADMLTRLPGSTRSGSCASCAAAASSTRGLDPCSAEPEL